MQFVKGNFLAGRCLTNVTDLNTKALEWCARQNNSWHKSIDMVPRQEHDKECSKVLVTMQKSPEILLYLCPPRRISFDGFVAYEGRRFGIPEFPTAAVKTVIEQTAPELPSNAFDRFDFSREAIDD